MKSFFFFYLLISAIAFAGLRNFFGGSCPSYLGASGNTKYITLNSTGNINFGQILGFHYTDPWTICASVKNGNVYRTIAGKHEGPPNYTGYEINTTNPTGTRFGLQVIYDLSHRIDFYNGSEEMTSVWKRVCGSYTGSGAGSGASVAVNGSYVSGTIATDTLGGNDITTTAPFRIGSRDGAEYYDGDIDNVVVYNHAPLTSAELAADYNSGHPNDMSASPTLCRSILFYAPLGEGADTTSDLAGHLSGTGLVNGTGTGVTITTGGVM